MERISSCAKGMFRSILMLKTLLNELGNTTEQLMKLCALGAIESIEKSALWGTEAVKMHL